MKKINNIMPYLFIVLLLILTIKLSTSYAATLVSSEAVIYSDTTVKEAIDDLYFRANKTSVSGASTYIRDFLTLDSDHNDTTFEYKTLPPGNYALIEFSTLYSMNSTSYSNWTIGSFSTLKGAPTGGEAIVKSSTRNFYVFTLTSAATPQVYIHNYYPNNTSSNTYNFIIAEVVDSDTFKTSVTDQTWTLPELDAGEYYLIEQSDLYQFASKGASYSNWTVGDFHTFTAGNSEHGQLIDKTNFWMYSLVLNNSAIPSVKVHDYYPNNTSIQTYRYYFLKIR